MLDERGVKYRYREYTEEPLSKAEITKILATLRMRPADVLRKNDKVYAELGLTGSEPDAKLITLFAKHPTLLQRPIGVNGNKAVIGRPPEKLLELI